MSAWPAVDVSTLSDDEARTLLRKLADRYDLHFQPAKPLRDWEEFEASGHAMENADGTIVLRLHHPVESKGDKVSRVTVRRVKVRDMRAAESGGAHTDLNALTTSLVEPSVFDDLEHNDDARLFLAAGARQLGKFMGTTPKPTTEGASDASSVSSARTSGSPLQI